MSRRIRTRFQRIAAVAYIATMGTIAVAGGVANAEEAETPDPEPVQLDLHVASPDGGGYLTRAADVGLRS